MNEIFVKKNFWCLSTRIQNRLCQYTFVVHFVSDLASKGSLKEFGLDFVWVIILLHIKM